MALFFCIIYYYGQGDWRFSMSTNLSNFHTLSSLHKQDLQNIAFENVNVSIFVLDVETGLIVACNPRSCSDLSLEYNKILGFTPGKVFSSDFAKFIRNLYKRTTCDTCTSELFYHTADDMWDYVTLQKISMSSGLKLAVFSVTKVSNIQDKQLLYHHMAYYDTLLNIPNGNKLEEDFQKIDSYKHVALIHFDIKRFSIINEVFGWDTGDFLLTQIRDWMLDTALEGCTLYSENHGQFTLLIQDISFADAENRAQQIVVRFKDPWKTLRKDDLPLYCTITIGLMYGNVMRGDVRNQLFRLLNSPSDGKSLIVYDAEMDKEIKYRFLLRQSLITCIQQGMKGFSLVYQPIVDTKTETWTGAEALCRWNSPEVGPVAPNIFVRIIEDIDLADVLDNWVLQTALKECGKLGLGEKTFLLNVNLSPVQDFGKDFLGYVQNSLHKNNFPTFKLCIEITESAKFDFSDKNLDLLQKLLDSGIQIALDDFGTGYSTFQHLIHLPSHILKIEKSFVDDLAENTYRKYLFKMMLDLAHTANRKVVVEGVETEEQKNLIAAYGADFTQGYYYSPPLSLEALEKNIDKFK